MCVFLCVWVCMCVWVNKLGISIKCILPLYVDINNVTCSHSFCCTVFQRIANGCWCIWMRFSKLNEPASLVLAMTSAVHLIATYIRFFSCRPDELKARCRIWFRQQECPRLYLNNVLIRILFTSFTTNGSWVYTMRSDKNAYRGEDQITRITFFQWYFLMRWNSVIEFLQKCVWVVSGILEIRREFSNITR